MIHPRLLTTATALTLAALLLSGAAGLGDAVIACVCPDGRVEVTDATACTCCNPVGSEERVAGRHPATENSFCSDCADVPLRAPFGKNDPPNLDTVPDKARCHTALTAPVIGQERQLASSFDQGRRLTLALISSVVLLT